PPPGAPVAPPAQVVPPARTGTTAATPAPKNAFEMIPARWSPNVPAMINIAAGNDAITIKTHERSLSPDVIWVLPEPAIEYASAAFSVMSRKKTAPRAALEAVAAVAHPPLPASRSSVDRAAA